MDCNEKWSVCNKKGDFGFIMNTFGVTASTARLLINRDKTTEEEIREFLYPDEDNLHPGTLMRNLKEAADIIEEKLSSLKKIRIIGDYDADGIMSTFILYDALKKLGAEADFYIPDRIRDGYGINADMIVKASEDGIDTVLTCDNGISATDAAEEAKKRGITLIVTDHHELPAELPEASIIVDPKHPEDTYPCKNICGAVVAAKLSAELLERHGLAAKNKGCLDYIEYMGIATICDVVPLEKENKTIASLGLKKLNEKYLLGDTTGDGSINMGLKALIDLCDIKGVISDHTVGFIIGPCLNATGRLDLAGRALHMLLAEDPAQALKYAGECRELNEERKSMTVSETEKALKGIESEGITDRVLIVELPDCHESLAGIIAGRIREKYIKPVFVLTKGKDMIKGSGRSIPGYNMFGEMQKCSELFTKFGGHPMAAGLSLPEENVAVFREKINALCTLTEEDMKKKVLLDAAVPISAFDEKSVEELQLFAPCGPENPAPLFGDRNNKVVRMRRIGKNNNFLKMTMEDSKGVRYSAVCFKDADEVILALSEKYGTAQVDRAFEGRDNDIRLTISYVPEINEYNGIRSIQMKIQGILY
ncbi:MAG: single-stranded-DNA-specific exonuclease RecJ [Lachnospiraceae bacterium]|nr:single-stranded-DNA-specific exonuclease RecJ [Lachnospiraceae bacterium]